MGTITRLIRSLFGLSSDGRDTETGTESQESEITIEREPETASEDAVKGTETVVSEPESGSEASTPADTPEPTGETDTAETAAEDTGTETADTESEAEETATETAEAEPEPTETAEPEPEPEDEPGAPVDEINGIGPTYSGRLDEAGIGTVPELAGSDPATVADAAQVSESRASNWIEQAENFA